MLGAVWSILTRTVCAASTLPALSVLKNSIVCSPSLDSEIVRPLWQRRR
jgi:hypothetical protein